MENIIFIIAMIAIVYIGQWVLEFLLPKIGPIFATMIAIFGVISMFGLTWLFSTVFSL